MPMPDSQDTHITGDDHKYSRASAEFLDKVYRERYRTEEALARAVRETLAFADFALHGRPADFTPAKLATTLGASESAARHTLKIIIEKSSTPATSTDHRVLRFGPLLFLSVLAECLAVASAKAGSVAASDLRKSEGAESDKPPHSNTGNTGNTGNRANTQTLLTAEVRHAIGTPPLNDQDPFLLAFTSWLTSAFEAAGVISYRSSTLAHESATAAIETFKKFLAGPSAAAAALRDYLALPAAKAQPAAALALGSMDETLDRWVDSATRRTARRHAADWDDYRNTMRSLPDQSDTMFNESFGVSAVFQPPLIAYHVRGRWAYNSSPDTVADIGRLIGGLISGRVPSEDLIIISGGPGSGKSTICRLIAARLAAMPHMHPVFLRLRSAKEGSDVTSFIEESLKQRGLIDRISDLRSIPNVVLILDGFDELAVSSRARLTRFFNLLRDGMSEGPLRHAKVIVSGRDTLFPGGEGLPSGSHVLALQPFDRARVEAWGKLWRRQHQTGPGSTFHPESLMDTATSGRAQPLIHLVTWPLTLHLLAQIHTSGRFDIAASGESIEKAYLYRSILAETARRQEQQTHGLGRFDPKRMRKFLRRLAWEMYQRSIDAMDVVDVEPLLTEFYPDKKGDLSELADIAVVNAPELTKGEETGFEFVHKSFSEFLVAEHIATLVEHAIFKAPTYDADAPTWRMSENEAAATLAPAIAVRPLPTEVQEMLEPMLGVFKPFSNGTRVGDDVAADIRRNGLERLLERFERLYTAAVGGDALATVSTETRGHHIVTSPLEAYANHCLGVVLIGAAAARRLSTLNKAANEPPTFFQYEQRPGLFWRFMSIIQAGGIAIDRPLAIRLFEGASVKTARGGLSDLSFPINFAYFDFLDSYDSQVNHTAYRAVSEVAATLLFVYISLILRGEELVDVEIEIVSRYISRMREFPRLLSQLGDLGLVDRGAESRFSSTNELFMRLRGPRPHSDRRYGSPHDRAELAMRELGRLLGRDELSIDTDFLYFMRRWLDRRYDYPRPLARPYLDDPGAPPSRP